MTTAVNSATATDIPAIKHSLHAFHTSCLISSYCFVHILKYIWVIYSHSSLLFWVNSKLRARRSTLFSVMMRRESGLRKTNFQCCIPLLLQSSPILRQWLCKMLRKHEAQLSQRDRATLSVSWSLVSCCTTVRKIPFENACNMWMTLQVTQPDLKQRY